MGLLVQFVWPGSHLGCSALHLHDSQAHRQAATIDACCKASDSRSCQVAGKSGDSPSPLIGAAHSAERKDNAGPSAMTAVAAAAAAAAAAAVVVDRRLSCRSEFVSDSNHRRGF